MDGSRRERFPTLRVAFVTPGVNDYNCGKGHVESLTGGRERERNAIRADEADRLRILKIRAATTTVRTKGHGYTVVALRTLDRACLMRARVG